MPPHTPNWPVGKSVGHSLNLIIDIGGLRPLEAEQPLGGQSWVKQESGRGSKTHGRSPLLVSRFLPSVPALTSLNDANCKLKETPPCPRWLWPPCFVTATKFQLKYPWS